MSYVRSATFRRSIVRQHALHVDPIRVHSVLEVAVFDCGAVLHVKLGNPQRATRCDKGKRIRSTCEPRLAGNNIRRAMIIIYTTIIYLAVLFGTGIISFNL